jgi:DNA-binding IclR family transcriptional regulator
MKVTEGRGVQSIEVGGKLLQILSQTEQPMKLSELAREADLSVPQTYAYLTSFRKNDMVEQDPRTGHYYLGPFALMLGISRMRSFDPLRMVTEEVIRFASQIRFTVALSVWGTHGPTVLMTHEGPDPVYMKTRAGTVYSTSGTATGRVFAAYLPDATIKKALEMESLDGDNSRYVGQACSFKELKAALPLIRYKGYGSIYPLPIAGINAIAAPILDHAGQIQMVITIAGSDKKLDTSDNSPQVNKLLTFTRYISAQLGYES